MMHRCCWLRYRGHMADMAYMQQAYGLRYYTRSRRADTPACMLAPLVADTMQATGQFQALYATPGSIAVDMRLDDLTGFCLVNQSR